MERNVKTLAYINLYAILGNLETLCKLDSEAAKLANTKTGKDISIAFNVTDGPTGKLVFSKGACKFVPEDLRASITLKFFSNEKFNDLIDGKKVMPFPYGNIFKLGFVQKNFTELTNILTKYLRASEEDLKDKEFFDKSTELMFNLIVAAIAQIGNHDKLGKTSAKRIVDGQVSFEIKNVAKAYIDVKDHKLTFHRGEAPNPRSFMIFDSTETARSLFDGKMDAMTCIARGKIEMKGHIGQIDNINRILGRVGFYLA